MYLSSLELTQFRNLSREFSFKPGINILVADNGSGKTNMLESIYMLCYGKSFKAADEKNILKEGEEYFRVIGMDQAENTLSYFYENQTTKRARKVLEYNGNKVVPGVFITYLQSILFSPHSVQLIDGPPNIRRFAIDAILSKVYPDYAQLHKTYTSVVRNRNRLLQREDGIDDKELSFWTEELIQKGSVIISKRILYLAEISEFLVTLSKKLFHKPISDLNVDYISKFSPRLTFQKSEKIEHIMKEYIKENHYKERRAGVSLYGPHREDFVFKIGHRDVKQFSSRGEQRLVSLIFTLAEAEFIELHLKMKPILLLDDLFSELDDTHSNKILSYLSELENQIIITTTRKAFAKTKKKIAAHVLSIS